MPAVQTENILLDTPKVQLVIFQQMRLGRLRFNTTFQAHSLNNILLEYTPTYRVITGEAIIFQSEMLEIFKTLIANSTHPLSLLEGEATLPLVLQNDVDKLQPRYVISIFLEFLRSLIEN